jgi:hydroxymethylglutaryl-CoA reductase (NADPH)
MASTALKHTRIFSIPESKAGIENFIGVAQVPVGLAGPLLIRGEHAKGEFSVPLATTEGTLVASYSRGMKLLNLAGGVTCTVLADRMQRAPVFVFANAREARVFGAWIKCRQAAIAKIAESTSKIARLQTIDVFLASKLAFLRFSYYTGDAAGQNMVTRATAEACEWILQNFRFPPQAFYLEGNMATDKKASALNVLGTRGKRVVAEATIPRGILKAVLRTTPEQMCGLTGALSMGAMLAGANNNGLHSANGIAAIFIATGQDVANVAEASTAIYHTEATPEGLYASITLPSLIVATHGGGTGLPTQRECLETMGCVGVGTAYKLAEIVAGTVLAGELSLQAAILSGDWVSSHERYGRHR